MNSNEISRRRFLEDFVPEWDRRWWAADRVKVYDAAAWSCIRARA
jgi:hypothetical protein